MCGEVRRHIRCQDARHTASLLVEGTLMVIAISAILHLARVDRGLPAGAATATGRGLDGRTRVLARDLGR